MTILDLSPRLVTAVVAGSVALLLLGIIAVPWILTRLPPDYFLTERPPFANYPRGWRHGLLVAKNALALALLVVGLAMLVLPGQGLLTLFVALILMDFPGKKRLERRIASFAPLLRAINALRRRAHRPPLRLE